MTFNSKAIIQDVRKDFEQMLDYVTGETAQTATADETERGLFKLLIQMGAKLLTLFFVMRSQSTSREPFQASNGCVLRYHRDTERHYVSIFGKLCFARPYFYRPGQKGQSPLDAELSLGEDCYSDLVREVSEYLGVNGVYHKSCDILERLLGLPLSTRVVAKNLSEDAVDVEAYYVQKAAPEVSTEAEILVIQADGKGVPMILEEIPAGKVRLGKGEKHGRKKEAVVTCAYTIASSIRTPAQVTASIYEQVDRPTPPSQPQNKHLWATLDGKEKALQRLSVQVASRQGKHILHQQALCDGCEALQSRLQQQFPDFTLVLDFIHANEYLWDVANALLGETNEERFEWMKTRTLQILSGQTEHLIGELRRIANQPKCRLFLRTQLHKTANYFERNLPYMDYPTYLSRGWPIASGVIEGACRHFVKDRCELSGMRWLQTGAENLLRLRAVAENNDWDDYHAYRKQQRHHRLYASLPISLETVEVQAFREPLLSNCQDTFHQLPLAA